MSIHTGVAHNGPQVAVAAESSFIVVWYEYLSDGSGFGIAGRRGAASGPPLATEFQVNSYTSGFQSQPAIAMESDGDFLIAWMGEELSSSDLDVFAQRFGASGARLGSEFRVNTHQPNSQNVASIAAHPDRPEFVIAWQSEAQDGSIGGVFFQRYAGVTMDIDGNGVNDPLTDGLLFLRYLRGAILTTGAVAGNCTRCTAGEIEVFLDGVL